MLPIHRLLAVPLLVLLAGLALMPTMRAATSYSDSSGVLSPSISAAGYTAQPTLLERLVAPASPAPVRSVLAALASYAFKLSAALCLMSFAGLAYLFGPKVRSLGSGLMQRKRRVDLASLWRTYFDSLRSPRAHSPVLQC